MVHDLIGVSVLVLSLSIVSGMVLVASSRLHDPSSLRPQPLWHISGAGRSSPVRNDGSVYVLSRTHEVLAIDEGSGHVRWRRSIGTGASGTVGSRLVIAAGVVIAGDDEVVALGVEDGKPRWRFRGDGQGGLGPYLGAALADRVLVGSATGALYAISTETGNELWRRSVDDSHTVVQPPVADDQLIVAAVGNVRRPAAGGLVAFDVMTGVERWRASLPASGKGASAAPAGGPLLYGDNVIVAGRDGAIHAFDRHGGARRWTIPALRRPDAPSQAFVPEDYRALAASGGTLVAGSLTGLVAAYDLATRREVWRHAGEETSVGFGIVLKQGIAYVPYLSGHLIALSLSDGQERWRLGEGGEGFIRPPLVTDTHIFLSSVLSGYFAFRRHD